MREMYAIVKDHLEQAREILCDADKDARKLREILQMTINVIDGLDLEAPGRGATVIDFRARSKRR